MLKFLEIKYLVVLVAASLVGIIYIQVSGVGPALQANAPLVRYWNQHRQGANGSEFESVRRNVENATEGALEGRRLRWLRDLLSRVTPATALLRWANQSLLH
jgi:hypothetical protein